MGTFKLYSGDDGQSHIETIDLDQTPDWKSAQDATTISFGEAPAGRFSDWHTAPRRQFVIILSGQLEIGLGDGSKHVFGPGDARSGGGYHRPRPHHRYARRPGLRYLHHPPGQPVTNAAREATLKWEACPHGIGHHRPTSLLRLPGWREGRPPESLQSLADCAGHGLVLGLMDALELERPNLMGHSIGGWTGLESGDPKPRAGQPDDNGKPDGFGLLRLTAKSTQIEISR